ncbi:dethiobiotin synthase [Sinimarinibacterium sp. CAU 1509]|uniref:dethiobiotin synthase n=1 Tax=Sinimarinibacterium sp. CAU 1509 TaxID=2562283 RepID=UPI0010AC109E|nr:dethiobiotin synthase [Sinimarinibacterium sp. CAU 1509]TJY58952.1 dethiobiotin synthase [Sinimarinibacterium sp. CAU 1509]
MAQTLFVTGTDTGVGKTRVAVAVLTALRQRGLRACGYKPVASGCIRTPDGLRNDDALALQAASTPGLRYAQINPLALEPAIAPHLAARQAGIEIRLDQLDRAHAELEADHDWIVVEGAGGWSVPLNDTQTIGDWVACRQWPVLLVVGMRLGCINHALLSADAIEARTALAAWVANTLPPAMPMLEDNIESLRARLPAPLWGVVPEGAEAESAAAALSSMTLPGRV